MLWILLKSSEDICGPHVSWECHWSNEVCLCALPGQHWKEITAVTFDMGGCQCCRHRFSALTAPLFSDSAPYKRMLPDKQQHVHAFIIQVITWHKIKLWQQQGLCLNSSIIHIRKRLHCLVLFLNLAAPNSYFHYNRSIPEGGHKVRWTLTPGFVGADWWYSQGLTRLSE